MAEYFIADLFPVDDRNLSEPYLIKQQKFK